MNKFLMILAVSVFALNLAGCMTAEERRDNEMFRAKHLDALKRSEEINKKNEAKCKLEKNCLEQYGIQ